MRNTIKINYLSRIEGDSGIIIEIKDGKISNLYLNVFEAPRFFESFLKGRPYYDVMDFTARICGICPVAYQMSSVHAIEKIFGIKVEEPIRQLRRLMYCGEWIESHALHIYLLNGPDFYGIESAWASKEYLPIAKRGITLKKLGNQIISLIGGRSVHPVSVRVGGFYKLPKRKDLQALLVALEDGFEKAIEGISWAAGLDFKDNSWDMHFISMSHPDEYPMNEGSVVSNKGLNLSMDSFFESIEEYQVEHSTSLYSRLKDRASFNHYIVGPLSRLNLNYEKLPDEIKSAIRNNGISIPITNTQMGIIARSIELAYAFYEAIRIIKDYEEADKPYVNFEPRSGEAIWITEAPRGMLIHRYEIDSEGYVKNCTLIPPTSQNLRHIERDIYHFIESNIHKPVEFLKKEAEKIIRSYDPCISCSVHLVVVS